MTVNGTVNKTSLLADPGPLHGQRELGAGTTAASAIGGWAIGASLGGLAVAIATIVRPRWSPVTAPIYALLQGVVLGLVSMWFEPRYPGSPSRPWPSPSACSGSCWSSTGPGWSRSPPAVPGHAFGATLGIAVVYLVSLVLGLFGVRVPFLYDASPLGILRISLAIVTVAASTWCSTST